MRPTGLERPTAELERHCIDMSLLRRSRVTAGCPSQAEVGQVVDKCIGDTIAAEGKLVPTMSQLRISSLYKERQIWMSSKIWLETREIVG